MRWSLVALAVCALFLLTAPLAKADGLLVDQCFEFATCWTSSVPTPWSDELSAGQLALIIEAAGSPRIPFIVEQNTESVIRLGVTTMTFFTFGGPVVESLDEFNGLGQYNDPCPSSLPYCETDTVGIFTVPDGAGGATISGTFGNSLVPNSAGECLYLGDTGSCAVTAQVPEPATLLLLGSGLVGLVSLGWRRSRQ